MTDESNEQQFAAETEESLDFSQTPEQQEEAQQQDPIVEEAQKFGHLSKEEWEAQGRDPNKWKPAEEFVKYGREYSEVKDLIKSLKQQNQQQTRQIDMLVDYHKQTIEKSVKQARQELEAQLAQARNLGDIDAVEKLVQAKAVADAQSQVEIEQQRQQERNQVDQTFMTRNAHWYNDSRPDLKQEAQKVSMEIASFYPNLSYAELVRRTEERMKFDHPEINVAPHQGRPQVSMANSNLNKSAASQAPQGEERMLRSLSAEDRAEYTAVKKLVESVPGIKYTVSEYIASNRGK